MRRFWELDFVDPLVCSVEGDGAAPSGSGPQSNNQSAPASDVVTTSVTPAEPIPPQPEPDPARPGWTKEAYEKQLNRQHRKIKELEQVAAKTSQLEAELAQMRELLTAKDRGANGAAPSPEPTPASPIRPQPTPQPSTAQPTSDRAALKQEARFEVQVEQLTESIKSNYKDDWQTVFDNMQRANSDERVTAEIVNAALATDDPAYVLVTVAKDPVRYQELMDMSPQRRLAEMVKISLAKPAGDKPAPKKPSAAPSPVQPVQPVRASGVNESGSADLYDDKYDYKNSREDLDRDWFATRAKQKRDSVGRPWSVGGRAGARPH